MLQTTFWASITDIWLVFHWINSYLPITGLGAGAARILLTLDSLGALRHFLWCFRMIVAPNLAACQTIENHKVDLMKSINTYGIYTP